MFDGSLALTVKTYAWKEAFEASKTYFKGDELAADVFLKKYALRDDDDNLLESTPDQMHWRLAEEFARIEQKYPNPLSAETIFSYLKNFSKIAPQGSPMSGIGNPYQLQSLSNCFVIEPPADSYGGILKTDQEQAQIMKRRGGVGFDVSTIRPKGLRTRNAARTTDGIGIFMERFSNTCREVAQGGRRGALMLTLDVHHPEIMTFLEIKKDKTKVTGANISVRYSDEFMEAVRDDKEVQLRFPVDQKENPLVEKWVRARDIWNKAMECAWDSAEPGALFWGHARRMTPADCYPEFRSISTNPCGEIILSAYDSCRLLLMNLFGFVERMFTAQSDFDWVGFRDAVWVAQRLMDDLIDLEIEMIDKIISKVKADPEDFTVKAPEIALWTKIRNAAIRGRRTGLGVTALGDCMAALNVKYGSPLSAAVTESIYKELTVTAYKSSVKLAEERGAFPAYNPDLEKDNEYLQRVLGSDPELKAAHEKYGRRNIAITTTAPAGSVSILTQTTSGIEPAFMASYIRKRKINPEDVESRVDEVDELGDKWQKYPVFHHHFKTWMEVTGKTSVEESPYYHAQAMDIDWVASVELQAAAQKWVCHAISKTCNLPKEATVDLVKQVYVKAWESGCKGFTIYREGSRSGVLVSDDDSGLVIRDCAAPPRPKKLKADIHHCRIKGQQWTIVVGLLDGRPYEVFGGLSENLEVHKKFKEGVVERNGKKDGVTTYNLFFGPENTVIEDIVSAFANPNYGAFTRTLSLVLRHGVPLTHMVEQLQKDKYSDMQSFARVMARTLKQYIKDGTKSATETKCQSCGAEGSVIYEEHCLKCTSCGSSKCG